MGTIQCPHCRTVQLSPPSPHALCGACRRPLGIPGGSSGIAAGTQAPLPPHLANAPPAPPAPPPVVRAPVDLRPKHAQPPPPAKPAEPPAPPKEVVQRPPGRGLWLEFGLLFLVVLVLGGWVWLAIAFIPPVDLTAKAAAQKDANVVVMPTEPAAPGEPEYWIDMSKRSVRKSGLRVRVDRVLHQTVMGRDADRQTMAADDQPHLQIFVHLKNDGKTVKNYKPWYGNRFMVDGKRRGAILVDDQGRSYPEATFPQLTEVQGAALESNLQPKEELSDILIFDLPPDVFPRDVKYWRLTLPAGATGDSGVLRLEIPQSMLE